MLDEKRISKEIDDALNQVRTNPRFLLPYLEERKQFFKGNTIHRQLQNPLMTAEGPAAVVEAIEFLSNQPSLHCLRNNDDLNLAAQEHAKDIGPKSIIGHIGSNGSTVSSRFAKYGD